MARINVDDDIETRPEYRRLVKILEGNDHEALGLLVNFWRLAQKYWGEGKLVPIEDVETWGFEPLVESKWAVIREEGVYAKGSEERFAWYRQRVQAGKSRSEAPRGDNGQFIGSTPAEVQRTTSEAPAETPSTVIPHQPLVPAPVLAPALVHKENIYTAPREIRREAPKVPKEHRAECLEVWKKTLARYKITKTTDSDEAEIARLIMTYGFERTRLALLGAGFEAASDKYKPKEHCRITRLWKREIFDLFENLGAQQMPGGDAENDARSKFRKELEEANQKLKAGGDL